MKGLHLALIFCGFSIATSPLLGAAQAAQSSESAFLGRWDLTLKAPDREYPSWLDVTLDGSALKAEFVGRWGNARPLPKIEISDGALKFVSPKEEEDSKQDLSFEGRLTGATLSGTVNGPDGKEWKWTGVKAPALKSPHTPKWGKPIQLFNGKDLSGWKASGPGPTWTVQDGNLITPGHGQELINDQQFKDFKLQVEFKCDKDSNSGVYLRGRYEVQVETDSQAEPASHHTGGVYGFLAASPELPRSPDQWQTFDITLLGRMLTVVQNGKTVINNQEIPGITGGALNSHEGEPGPIYLQGSEKGHVSYRKIELTPAE
ncbi:MAG: DUF1080 domain-containing protein [Acidobacteria bacterium]|nr:DUF1080 domain-containing protein [Acidobacteriota bacterium]